MRTGPGNKDAHASWLWPVPSGPAADLEFVELKLLRQLWFLKFEIPKLEVLELDLLSLEPLKLELLDS